MSGDIDAKAAAINEYGKLMLQHKVRPARGVHRGSHPSRRARVPRRVFPLDLTPPRGTLTPLQISRFSTTAGARRQGPEAPRRGEGDEEDVRQDRGRSQGVAEHGADHRRGSPSARRREVCVSETRILRSSRPSFRERYDLPRPVISDADHQHTPTHLVRCRYTTYRIQSS